MFNQLGSDSGVQQGDRLAAPRLPGHIRIGILILATVMFAIALVGGNPILSQVQATSGSPGISVAQKIPGVRIPAPTRVRIPVLSVSSRLMSLGLQRDGTLQVPPNGYTSGWYVGGPRPGEIGPAVIAAHVHWNGRWAVFQHLSKLKYGDRIIVDQKDGSSAHFRVTRVARFKKSKFPTTLVYGNSSYAGLRLITCDSFNVARRAYMDNVVVFATLITSRPLGL